MLLYLSSTSSVRELAAIGDVADYGNSKSFQAAYDNAIKSPIFPENTSHSIIMASVKTTQKSAQKLLLKNGFMQVGRPKKNPNSGNSIILFVKFINPVDEHKTKRKRK